MNLNRVLVVTSNDMTEVPPRGYAGLGRLAYAAAFEFARHGVEVVLCAPRLNRDATHSSLLLYEWPPNADILASVDAVHCTDPNTLCELGDAPERFPRTLFVCEQNAPWVEGYRGPNARHVVFRSDRLPLFEPGESWLCDQVLMRDEVGPPLPSKGHLLWIGRIHPDKAPDALVTFAAAVPDLSVVVLGPAHSREPTWPDNVRRHWEAAGPQKAQIVRTAAGFVYTVSPDWVGAGELVLTEAVACGIPLLAQSFSPGCPAGRLIVEGGNGFRRSEPQKLARLVPHALQLDRQALHAQAWPRLAPATVAHQRLTRMDRALLGLRGRSASVPVPALPTQRLLRTARAKMAEQDWHGAIDVCGSALNAPGRGEIDGQRGRVGLALCLAEALLGAGREQETRGESEAAARSFQAGAELLAPLVVNNSPALRLIAEPLWLLLDRSARAQRQAQALEGLSAFLIDHDELSKAVRLLDVVPWMLQDHPVTMELERRVAPMRQHLKDPDAYRAYYEQEHIDEPVLYHEDRRAWLPRAWDAIEVVRSHAPAGRVLEVGCFDGPVGFPVVVELPEVEYVGVDPNSAGLERFRSLLNRRGLRADLRAELRTPDGCFDVVLWTEVIEYVPDPIEELNTLATHLRPGGLIFITTPWGSYDQGRRPAPKSDRPALGHVRAMTPRDLVAAIHAAGLRCRRLWRSPSGRTRGDSLHAVVEQTPQPSKSVSFLGGNRTKVMPLARALAVGFEVSVYGTNKEASIIDRVACWPRIQARHARGPLVSVDAFDERASLVWLTRAPESERLPSQPVLVASPQIARVVRCRWEIDPLVVPPIDPNNPAPVVEGWTHALQSVVVLNSVAGTQTP